MDKTVHSIAVRLGTLMFFVMALAAWLCGHEPAVCTWRAVIGATALYLVIRIAGNLAVRILLEAMAQDQARRREKKY